MIEEFKDRIKGLKNILVEIKKTRTIERTRNKWNKKWNKKGVKYVRWWNKRCITKVRCRFYNFNNKIKFFEKPHGFEGVEKERELRILATKKKKKKKKNEIERLKEEVKSNEYKLLDSETKSFKLLFSSICPSTLPIIRNKGFTL